jgi:hypothetical protein
MFVSTSTREPISVGQATEFAQFFESTFMNSIPYLVDENPSGGVMIEDASNASKKRNRGPGMKTVSLTLGYDVVKRDAMTGKAQHVEAVRIIQPSGAAPMVKGRLYLKRGSEDGRSMDRTVEESLERLSLMI